MTGLDWIIVAFALLLAVLGFGRGFIVGMLSVIGFGLGAVIGTRLGPELLRQGSASPYAPAFGLAGALLGGAILATGLEGLGFRLRGLLRIALLGWVDGVLGALLSACVALGIVWIGASVALQAPGNRQLRIAIQRSVILGELNALLPPSGPILNALARFDPLPSIAGPAPGLPAPQPAIARGARVRAAAASVVRVLGSACGLGVEGSGWVARPGEVVTNAHVVAGEQDTTVQIAGRPPNLPAQAIAFDAHDDIAVLRVRDLPAPPLSLASAGADGAPGAIMGFPHDGPFNVAPARIGASRPVITQDAYGQGPVTRLLTPFRGLVRSGNSGGPIVGVDGRVLTTVFAAATGGGPRGGYGVANSVVRGLLAHARDPVGTGPCAR